MEGQTDKLNIKLACRLAYTWTDRLGGVLCYQRIGFEAEYSFMKITFHDITYLFNNNLK